MKLLLIEDEDFIRDLYKRQLELAGMPTDAFGLGNDGLNSAHQTPTAYDLILLDIMLPDTNGLQILKDLKQNNATKHIPVILLTNLSQDMLIKEGFELGAEGYLVKAAYTPAQIVQEVKNILAKKQSQSATPASPPPIQPQPTAEPLNTSPMPAPTFSPSLTPTPAEPSPPTPATPSTDPMTPPSPAMPDPMSAPPPPPMPSADVPMTPPAMPGSEPAIPSTPVMPSPDPMMPPTPAIPDPATPTLPTPPAESATPADPTLTPPSTDPNNTQS